VDTFAGRLDQRLNIRLASSAAGQTFAKIDRAIQAKSLPARPANAHGLSVFMLKATHSNWTSNNNASNGAPGFADWQAIVVL
jgi:hypothetical protein